MLITTLTTDYGIDDFYVASLKGHIHGSCEAVSIVDVSHTIPRGNIIKSAYFIRSVVSNFPKNTLHICTVDAKNGNNRYLLAERNEHYFLLPDNGIITLMYPELDFNAYVLDYLKPDFTYGEANKLIAKVCQAIEKGMKPAQMGAPTTSYQILTNLAPVKRGNFLRGMVIFSDHFSNAIVNITREMFDEFVADNPKYSIIFGKYRIENISRNYSDVPKIEIACIFNESGYMEIGVNEGNAVGLLGLNEGSSVIVEID
jgi:S-adenosyl-L-methionine hydrolase (adenosine-forming)